MLDVSHNRLNQIDQISFMANLRIINITGNINLTKLPHQLTTCDSLVDIVFDPDQIQYPPANIVERGTAEILKYLLEQNGGPHEENLMTTVSTVTKKSAPAHNIKQTTANMLDVERGRDIVREMNSTNDNYSHSKVKYHSIFFDNVSRHDKNQIKHIHML